jgi:hypothetical protein
MPALLSARTSRALLAAALLALLCGRTPPARADDAPAGAAGDGYNPADADHDGVVTRKEARRYRRALRRRARASTADADSDADSDAKADAQTDAAAEHSAAAAAGAAGAASALKNSLPTTDAGTDLKPGGPGGMTGSAKNGGSGAGAGTDMKASGNPADPKTPADFALAARSGYAPAFAAAGLKLGPDGRTIVRADGSPATAEDYARLRGGILAMPSALTRRPDFFSAVSPGHFNDLKKGYHEKPELSDSVYKHVGTTAADRDFVHTASCAKMSGECNASVDKASYKKGDFVAPEDLDRMWGALQRELDDASGDPDGESALHGPLKIPKTSPAADQEGTDATATPGAKALAGTKAAGGTAAGGALVPAGNAARYAKKLWRSATVALGLGGGPGDDPSSHALELGALGAAALAALIFALRKKV